MYGAVETTVRRRGGLASVGGDENGLSVRGFFPSDAKEGPRHHGRNGRVRHGEKKPIPQAVVDALVELFKAAVHARTIVRSARPGQLYGLGAALDRLGKCRLDYERALRISGLVAS